MNYLRPSFQTEYRFLIRRSTVQSEVENSSKLEELMMFDISRNDKIISIPNEYGLLKHLFSFKIDGLNNLQIPRDLKPVDGKNIRPLMEFLSQRLRKQVQHSYLKVFMAGKSTGLKRTILQALDPEVFRGKPGTQ